MSRREYTDFTAGIGFPTVKLSKDAITPIKGVNGSYFTSGGSTKHSPELRIAVESFLRNLPRPYLHVVEIPFAEPLRSSLKRFLLSVEAYYKSSNPLIPLIDLLIGAASGPSYAEFLKRLRFKSFITSVKGLVFQDPDWWNEITPLPIKDIGDIFNYQYLPHWEEECNDYEFGFLPVNTDEKQLNKFRKMLEVLLGDSEVDRIDPREVLLSSSGSVSLNSDTLKKGKLYELKQRKSLNVYSHSSQPKLRTVIQIGPQNCRDTVINTISDLNKIKLIEYQTAKVVELFDANTVNKDLNIFDAKYKKFQENFKWFLCRDFTKEGITKPRILLKIMLEVLHKKFPFMEAYQDTNFFDNLELQYEDKVFKPVRGHGLGMANSLTTLMQLVIFNLVIKKLPYDSSHYHLMTLNDDAIIGAKKTTEIEDYWQYEEDILSGLGLIRNPKKSFYCEGAGVFIERYFSKKLSKLNYKESYQRRELYMAYAATNIVQAKQIIASQVYLDKELLQLELERIALFWGYEFFPEEIRYPALCGGWYNESIYGVSLNLLKLDELPYNNEVYRAYKACQNCRLKPKYQKGEYRPPVLHLFPYHSHFIDDDVKGIFDIGTLYEVQCKYTTLRVNPELYIKAWEYLRKERQRIFYKKEDCPYRDFIREICKNSMIDHYPLDFMIERKIKTALFKGSIPDVYQSSNPLLSYLSSIKKLEGIDPNPWSILFTEPNAVNSKLTSSQRKRLKVVFGTLSLNGKLTKEYYVIPEDESEWTVLEESYFSPATFCKVIGELNNPWIPLIKEEYRNPIIKKKSEVFGRILSLKNIRVFNEYPNIGTYIARSSMNDHEIDLFLEEIDKFVLESIPIHSPEPEVEEEDSYFNFEGFIKVVTPSTYRTYLSEPWRAIGEVKKDFDELSRVYQIRQILGSEHVAKMSDITQETFLSAVRGLPALLRIIWNDVWGNPDDEPSEEEDEIQNLDFDLFE